MQRALGRGILPPVHDITILGAMATAEVIVGLYISSLLRRWP